MTRGGVVVIEFIAASENLPFTVAITVMLIIALMEGVTTVLGAGLSSVLETLLPEIDMDVDFESGGVQQTTPMVRFLGWLRVGQVPFLMLLVIFLTTFGLIGLGLQSFVQSTMGGLLPAWIAGVPTFLFTLPVVRLLAGVLGRIMPKDETEAVSDESFIGKVATITMGKTYKGSPTQAKLRDEHGLTHYILVEPDEEGETFYYSDPVLVVKKMGVVYSAIRNESAILTKEI